MQAGLSTPECLPPAGAALEVPPQEIITSDNVTVKVNAVIFFQVLDAQAAITRVYNDMEATSQIAQTTSRSVLGQSSLDELLGGREKINARLRTIIDGQTEVYFKCAQAQKEAQMMYWGFGGMHFFWWLFWFASIVMFFSFVVPVPRRRHALLRETPLDLLRRRYAAGELTTAEYDERKERLSADLPGQVARSIATPGPNPSSSTENPAP